MLAENRSNYSEKLDLDDQRANYKTPHKARLNWIDQ